MGVQDAMRGDLERLGPRAEESALAETALAVAKRLDSPKTGGAAASMCAKVMIDLLRELRALAPPVKEADGVTNINEKRRGRRDRGATAANS